MCYKMCVRLLSHYERALKNASMHLRQKYIMFSDLIASSSIGPTGDSPNTLDCFLPTMFWRGKKPHISTLEGLAIVRHHHTFLAHHSREIMTLWWTTESKNSLTYAHPLYMNCWMGYIWLIPFYTAWHYTLKDN